jgi:hypothetical protein
VKAIAAGAAIVLSGALLRVTRITRQPVHVRVAVPAHGHVRVAHLAVQPATHFHFSVVPWLAVAAVVFGIWSWHAARRRGLQHLGAAELRARWTNFRSVSKWGW